jgi:hypothetical protein
MRGIRVWPSLQKTDLRPGSYLARKGQYLTGERGSVFINQWALRSRGWIMREVLLALAEQLAFFFEPPAYQLVDSGVGSMGDAYVTLRGECLIWRVVRDRSQLYLECRSPDGSDDRWITTDLLIRLLEGRRVQSAELDTETAAWVGSHLRDIEARFTPDAVSATIAELQGSKRRRANELFD